MNCRLLTLATLACGLAMGAPALAQQYEETFPDPLGGWLDRWFGQYTNTGNYYTANGSNCDPNHRGNNPCGLWFAENRDCGGGVAGPTCEIRFDPSFGATITSIEFDLSAYIQLDLTIYDMNDNPILEVIDVVRTSNVCAGHTYSATSNNGVSRIFFDSRPYGSSQVSGNNAIDNIKVEAGPPSLRIDVSGSCPGLVTVEWNNATPSTAAGLVFARNQGSFTITGGPCDGTQLGLGSNQIQLVRQFNTGANGSGTMSGNAGVGACGGFLQVVVADGSPCDTSNVGQIP